MTERAGSLVIAALIAAASALGVQTAVATKPKRAPRGAVALPATSIKTVGATTCGRLKGRWMAGRASRVGKTRYFVSFEGQAAAQVAGARRMSGARKKAALRRANRAMARAKTLNATCSGKTTSPAGGTDSSSLGPVRFVQLLGARALSITSKTPGAASVRTSLRNASGDANQTLEWVDARGVSKPAQASGPPVPVQSITIAPGNRIYAVLGSHFVYEPTGGTPPFTSKLGCNLAEIDRSSGALVCIEQLRAGQIGVQGSINKFTPNGGASGGLPTGVDGSIYYKVETRLGGPGSSSTCEVRRYRDGVKTVIAPSCTGWFKPLADGTVLMVDEGPSLRLWSSGVIRTVMTGQEPHSMGVFGDGNVYVGYYGRGSAPFDGLYRVDPVSATASAAPLPDCAAYGDPKPPVCFSAGSHAEITVLDDGSTYMLATSETDWFYGNGPTTQAYRFLAGGSPVRTVASAFDSVSGITAAGDKLILHGIQRSGLVNGHGLSVYDPSGAGTETMLVAPGDGYEIFHVRYTQATNEVWFDGFNDATTTYGLGKVDLDIGPASFTFTRSDKVIDFQLMG